MLDPQNLKVCIQVLSLIEQNRNILSNIRSSGGVTTSDEFCDGMSSSKQEMRYKEVINREEIEEKRLLRQLVSIGKRLFGAVGPTEKKEQRKERKKQMQRLKQEHDQKIKSQALLQLKKQNEKKVIAEQVNSHPTIAVTLHSPVWREHLIHMSEAMTKDSKEMNDNDPNVIEVKTDNSRVAIDREGREEFSLLQRSTRCHICSCKYKELHFFYHSLCPKCAALNYEKRVQTIDLTGKVAIVTGARIKIGYETSLKLLRSGCTVIATTRFPKDAAVRYAREQDYHSWKSNLKIYGIDLRHIPSIISFAEFLNKNLPRLDIVINNAAQTIQRPPLFYTKTINNELSSNWDDLCDDVKLTLASDWVLRVNSPPKNNALSSPSTSSLELSSSVGLSASNTTLLRVSKEASHIGQCSILSGIALDVENEINDTTVFPEDMTDTNGEQVDLRRLNSWHLKLDHVPIVEYLEVQTINATAPFLLCKHLRPLMARTIGDKFIINVSSMEGQFYKRYKSPNHVHTNMSKAALNMMTRTCGSDYVQDSIYMNSCDTGWVSDENPNGWSSRLICPLDELDGAMRVLDPIFSSIRDPTTKTHSLFYKNYTVTVW